LSLLDRVVSLLSASAALRRAIRLNKQSRMAQAFTLFARAAGAGIAEAEYRVGRCYLEGLGVPVSLTESVRWLARAAAQDHVEAQWWLAVLHIHGTSGDRQTIAAESAVASLFSARQPLEPDFVAAEKWARRAADHGSADGQAVLAYILTSGPESMRNLEEADRWYQRAA
jgi:TPR repeat protein